MAQNITEQPHEERNLQAHERYEMHHRFQQNQDQTEDQEEEKFFGMSKEHE